MYLGSGIVKAILDSGNEVISVDFGTDHVDDRAQKMTCNLFEVMAEDTWKMQR